jgi:hypothetical protein
MHLFYGCLFLDTTVLVSSRNWFPALTHTVGGEDHHDRKARDMLKCSSLLGAVAQQWRPSHNYVIHDS